MAKGIIVVDKIPQNCRNIRGDTERGCPHGGMVCQITGRDVMHHLETGIKPDWCPIQPMPEKKPLTGEVGSPRDVLEEVLRAGYNTCINEILKGADKNG